MKNINEWVEWMILNPELAEENYPQIMEGLRVQIRNSEPYLTALLIQKLPDHFPYWKSEVDKHFGIKRKKMIQGFIDLLQTVFNTQLPSEIEQKAVESVRAELTEQLEYWKKQIDTRFSLTTFEGKQEQKKHPYKSIQREIENNGCFIVNLDSDTVKIYTPELGVVFTSKDLHGNSGETDPLIPG